MAAQGERAVLFIDGNNWYHGLKRATVDDPARLDYRRIATKLVGAARVWSASRYYIGRVNQSWNPQLATEQLRFLSSFEAADNRHRVFFGRLEPREVRSEAAHELLAYLGTLKTKIDPTVYRDLVALGNRHKASFTLVEKSVDVMLAVDLVVMAQRNELDTAYVLSADGDYTHAVQFVRELGKKVFAVSASPGAQLAKVVNSFIRVDKGWFTDCYR